MAEYLGLAFWLAPLLILFIAGICGTLLESHYKKKWMVNIPKIRCIR